jgi:hypothetical protein
LNLKKSSIILPKNFMTVGSNCRPKFSPQQGTADRARGTDMSGLKALAAAFLLASLLAADAAQAMEFRQFGKVQLRDQGAYAAPLVQSAENVLNGDDKGNVTNSASKPMVTKNPDGTFTVQKLPRNGNSKDAKAKEGLVIPPQVVVPIIPTPAKKQ